VGGQVGGPWAVSAGGGSKTTSPIEECVRSGDRPGKPLGIEAKNTTKYSAWYELCCRPLVVAAGVVCETRE